MSDWIKIHRGVLDSFCFANPNHFKVWVWMLLKANYKKSFVPLNAGRGSTTIEVDRGQFIFGRNKASEELGLNGTAVYRILQKFEELKQISIEPNNHYSLITICNYNSYQNIKDKDEQQMNSKRTANEQLMDNKRTANEHIQEELEYKEGKEGIAHLNGFACYNVEEFILGNQQQFEKICIATSRKEDEVKKELHLYHLWLAKKEMYPMGKGAASAGIESWIHNSKTYKQKYGNTETVLTKIEKLPDANELAKKYG